MTGRLAAACLAALILAPAISLVLTALQGTSELWPHLVAYVLPQALRDTALLLTGVGLLVVVVGTGAAWLVAAYEFPGRRWLDAALLLPLAVPTYIVAYAYLDLLHPLGHGQVALRDLLGIERPGDLRLPDLRSLPGCVLLLGFVLYPYVYLPTRALFLMQAGTFVEAARTLGAGPMRTFLTIALPLARPAIALGTGLALMETLNDVGAAEFLGVRTLTVQVYATWVNRSDLPGAAQIAVVMLAGIVALVGFERLARGGRGYAGSGRRAQPMARRRLRGWRAAMALALGLVPIALGFLLPAGHLVVAAATRLRQAGVPSGLWREIGHTILYAGSATMLVAILGLLVAGSPRLVGAWPGRALIRIAGLGYALPGTILAIGLLGPLALIDSGLSRGFLAAFGTAPALVGLGTGGALVIAYSLRFLTVAVGATEAGLARIPASLPDAARVLGCSPLAALARVQVPLAWPAIVSGACLVFVDCVKELPATLLLRPLNVETLSTHLYGEAARGTYEDGALAALLIVAVGIGPVAILLRLAASEQQRLAI